MRRLLPVLSLVLLAGGCLIKETTHTLYIEPDDSVTWTVLEREIRSDSTDASERRKEEGAFLAAVQAAEHPVALAFDRLDPHSMETRILRDRAPFAVATEARLGRIDHTLQDWFDGLGLDGDAQLESRGRERTLSIVLRLSEEEPEGDETLAALVEEIGAYRLVLSEGRFHDATGFELSKDERIATPLELTDEVLEEAQRTNGTIEFALAWTASR